jgi:hypothetical protein
MDVFLEQDIICLEAQLRGVRLRLFTKEIDFWALHAHSTQESSSCVSINNNFHISKWPSRFDETSVIVVTLYYFANFHP